MGFKLSLFYYQISFGFNLSERFRKKGLRPFDLIIPLRVGRPFQGEHREAQAPPLCEYRLTGGVWLRNELLVSHPDYTGERVFLE